MSKDDTVRSAIQGVRRPARRAVKPANGTKFSVRGDCNAVVARNIGSGDSVRRPSSASTRIRRLIPENDLRQVQPRKAPKHTLKHTEIGD